MNAQIARDTWPGIYFDIPAEKYHQPDLGVATAGGLKRVRQSLAHYHHAHTAPPDARIETPAQRFGKAYHSYVLEPATFHQHYVVLPESAPRRPTPQQINAKKPSEETLAQIAFWATWDEENRGKTVIEAEWLRQMADMREALDRHPIARGMIAEGVAESTWQWIDERTGLRCKSRPDFWVEDLGFFMDLKTCEDASPRGFARAVTNFDYHVGHCHYADGARQLGRPIKNYLFLCQEKEAPYVPAVYTIDAAAEERGYEILHRSMDRLAEGVRTGRWPGYSEGIEQLVLPGYAFYD